MTDDDAPTPETTEVRDNPEKQRFDVLVGPDLAGFSRYLDMEVAGSPQRIFFHTRVFDEFEGRGLASTLTRAALHASIADGRWIVPVCPYVARWVANHDEADGHVDAVRQEHLDAVQGR